MRRTADPSFPTTASARGERGSGEPGGPESVFDEDLAIRLITGAPNSVPVSNSGRARRSTPPLSATVAPSFFDKGALGAACATHEQAVIEATWLDSVRVAKRAWPELPSHRLNVLTKFRSVRHKHHDARAAGMVIVRAIEHTGIELAGWLSLANGCCRLVPKAAALAPEGRARGDPRSGVRRPAGAVHGCAGARHVLGRHDHDQARHQRCQPFGRFVTAHADHRRAEGLRQGGGDDRDHLRERTASLLGPTAFVTRSELPVRRRSVAIERPPEGPYGYEAAKRPWTGKGARCEVSEFLQRGDQTVYLAVGAVMTEADADEPAPFLEIEAADRLDGVEVSRPGEDVARREMASAA